MGGLWLTTNAVSSIEERKPLFGIKLLQTIVALCLCGKEVF